MIFKTDIAFFYYYDNSWMVRPQPVFAHGIRAIGTRDKYYNRVTTHVSIHAYIYGKHLITTNVRLGMYYISRVFRFKSRPIKPVQTFRNIIQ